MPQKIRLRDLDPSLRALIAGGEATEGQINLLLSQYRKKTEVIKEQDIDAAYRTTIYGKINEVKSKLEEHLAQALVVAAKDLDPALLQRINSLEDKVGAIKPGKDYESEIKALQNSIKEIRDIIDALNVEGINRTLTSLSASINSAQNEINQIKVLNNTFLNRFSTVENILANKRDKDVSIKESDLDAAVVDKLNKGVTALSKTDSLTNTINEGLNKKRDKDVLISEDDLDSGVRSKLNTLAEVNETVTSLPAEMELLLAKKRDKNVPIAETDLNDSINEQLARIREIDSTISNLSVSVDNKLNGKRDKSVLIGRNDLSKPVNDELDKIDSLALQVNTYKTNMESALANKRDKGVAIKKSDLDSEVIQEFNRIDSLSSKIDTVKSDTTTLLNDKRDKNVAIKKNDLDSVVVQELDKITPLINRFNSFETSTNNALNAKRSKDVLINEADLNSALLNKINRGNSAVDAVAELSSRMNLFPNVQPGDYLTVNSANGSVSGKKVFIQMYSVADEADKNALVNNASVSTLFVRSTGKVYEKKNGSFAENASFFENNPSYWNTFIVDQTSNVIVAYVLSGGQVLRFNVKEQRKTATLNAGASISFACVNAMSVPVRVLAKESSGKYTPADGVVSVLYDAGSYTLRNESDENLNIVVIEG